MVETHAVAPSLVLRAPDGSAVDLSAVRARVERRGESLLDLWLEGELDPATWARADAEAWFHLHPDVRGPLFGGGFDPRDPVRVEARLAPEHAMVVGLLCETDDEILAQLREATAAPALRHTESWFALYVTQPAGPVRGGFRTTWANQAP